ncbi:tetratricopeptide repeat protein [Opitutus terrae]|uniref:Tetratricopeptide TPR_2 repeat protein n=1 Tax=Opitutus terrae (strain DSM 11246 / JCM 15787 / PB90-1) TaxID=452637 RepID=B1ZRW3_OPITP|nr:tetratricopeptide repeat protein [Opitutus terrae]ACB73809.1 Tetratricopeptide TPR_2 repeat protein [Opitutus terrae PB90-1]
MKRLLPRLLLVLAVLCAGVAGTFGWQRYSAARRWAKLRPPAPATLGTTAPGFDAQVAACAAKIQAWPPDQAALAEFANLCHANGQLESAAAAYDVLMQLQPTEARWPHRLAVIVAGYGQLDQAIPLLQKTTQLAPDYIVAWLKLGDAYLKSNAVPEASAAYDEVLRREPDSRYALIGLARCDLLSERLTAARAHLQRAVAGVTDFAGAQSLLAVVFDRLGNTEAAATARSRVQRSGHYTEPTDPWMEELMLQCHDPYVLLTAASTAWVEERAERAFALLERALTLAPGDARLHRQMAKMLSARGDLAGARRHLEEGVALAPTNDSIQLDLIGILHQLNDTAALQRVVAAGLAANPESPAMHFEAGMAAAAAGRLEEAAQHLEFTWRTSPDQIAAAIELANVYFRAGRGDDGVALLQDAITKFSHKPAPLLLVLIRHGIETGDPRTREWLQQAVASDPPAGLLADIRRDYQRRFGEPPP